MAASGLVQQIFVGFLVELLSVVVAWRFADDIRKRLLIVALGTIIAGVLAIPPILMDLQSQRALWNRQQTTSTADERGSLSSPSPYPTHTPYPTYTPYPTPTAGVPMAQPTSATAASAAPSPVVTSLPTAPIARRLERQECPGARCAYSVAIAANEVIVGDAYDFQDRGAACVAFAIMGPGTEEFSVLDGAWDRYSGVTTDSQIDEILASRVNYLTKQHWFCRYVRLPIIIIRPSGETIDYRQPASSIRLLESQKTGVGQRQVYESALQANEVIVGDGWDFQDQGHRCVVFILQGQGPARFSLLDGAWYRYFVGSEDQAEEVVQAFVGYLKTEHDYCRFVDFPVVRLTVGE
ncbi:MAG TPA: hypothetical protein VMW58_11800 [Anaerolineae bacterium]|nr:hypothetical protein [Anaerolineae bacterium]